MLLREEGNRDRARSILEDALRASRRTGDRPGLAYSSLGLACLAGDLTEWRRCAQLHGVAQAFLDQIGQSRLRYEQIRQASIDDARARIANAIAGVRRPRRRKAIAAVRGAGRARGRQARRTPAVGGRERLSGRGRTIRRREVVLRAA